jgi:hypothetical protein
MSPSGGKARFPAGRSNLQREDDFHQREGKNFSGKAIFSGGTPKNSAGPIVTGIVKKSRSPIQESGFGIFQT